MSMQPFLIIGMYADEYTGTVLYNNIDIAIPYGIAIAFPLGIGTGMNP